MDITHGRTNGCGPPADEPTARFAPIDLEFSERRARAVVAYLTENGVDGRQLDGVGMGESEPVADNGTSEGRAENRRVVVRRTEG